MENKQIAQIFREIAKLLELKDDNPFKIRAYQKAAQSIEDLEQNIIVLAEQDKLTEIPGIGKDLALKIKEILQTGKLNYHLQLKKEFPEGLLEMIKIPGLGPKTVKKIYEKFKIDTIEKLKEAVLAKKLIGVEGIKDKVQENILRGIELLEQGKSRSPLYIASQIAESFISKLKNAKEVTKIEVAGSLRRRKDTIRDIDILVVSDKPTFVIDKFSSLPMVKEVLSKGATKSSVIENQNNMQVDLRVVEEKSFGSALMYFTGSKEFNIKLRQLAGKNGFKINEYGIFKIKKEKEVWVGGKTEEEIFSILNMQYIPPQLREDRGEIEKASRYNLPKLITLKDIKGDLHIHSNYSDGFATIEQIVDRAQEFGYKYIGICDHSKSLKVAKGLSEKDVYKKLEEIRKINKKSKVYVLCGTEVDIDSDGRLDYKDELLKEFDIVIAAIHTAFKQSKEQLTKRIISACKNKYVNIIAHPTGKLWGVREPYTIDLEEILKVAYDYRVGLEINCYPQRLDLGDLDAMKAKNFGVKLSLGTDSHRLEHLKAIEFGIDVSQRAWLEKGDILNCMELDELFKWLKK
ncbi:MAG: DNA polymerase/3'-5' exonuclease PolX [Candidatus Omnitrophica bacterium]|nr:DNA polymerase/3'-5' exonuclease PolX [Candidatus Omnitrophota bacterium]